MTWGGRPGVGAPGVVPDPAADAAPAPVTGGEAPSTARPLLRHAAAPSPGGAIHAIEPADAGWSFVGFAAHRLDKGATLVAPASDREHLVLVLEGRAAIRVGASHFGEVGTRSSVFDGPPPAVILAAPGDDLELVAG